ncbi:hypothetical protein ABID29_001550 [Streptococcus rupicaprae]|uniref:WYL domain-containing protein n=1 Tax=Streptococcus rupicaprae TaxID=759619 RepID=A0ABV2FJ05_9STRE
METNRLCLSNVLQAIILTNKTEEKHFGWTTQEIAINELFQLFGVQTLKNNYYVLPPQCSLYFQQRKNIPTRLRRFFYQNNHSQESLTAISQELQKERNFPTKLVAQKIRCLTFEKHHILEPDDPKIDSDFLCQLIQQQRYADYLTWVFFYCLTRLSNTETFSNHDLLNSEFIQQDFLDQIQRKQFYEFYHHDIVVIPRMAQRNFKIIHKKSYQTYFPKPSEPQKDYFEFKYSFTQKELLESSRLTSLIINGVEYILEVEAEERYVENDKYPYKVFYRLRSFAHQDSYLVQTEHEYIAPFPIRIKHFKLLSPAKQFKCNVRIQSHQSHKFVLILKQFGDYNPNKNNIDMTVPNATMSYFENKNWTFPSSGYSYLIKPRDDFWQECLPLAPTSEAEDFPKAY